MGNPHRFFGDGTPIDLVEGGTIPARCAVEVTFRTLHQQFLMRPSEEVNAAILACLGRAHHRYPELKLYVIDCLSDHGSFVCLPPNAFVLWSFMRDFLSNLARKLNDHHDREGKFWERRYRAIPILDEASLEERFAYCLVQGTKENLVWSARDWPGVSSVGQLLGGPQMVGRWRDHETDYERARQRTRKIARAALRDEILELPEVGETWIEYPIELTPLPHWEHLEPEERHSRVASILDADDEATRVRHRRDGTAPLGVAGIRAASPYARPADPKKSPAPFCHTASKALRDGFLGLRSHFAETLRGAVDRLEPKLASVGLLVGMSTPPLCLKSTEPSKHNGTTEVPYAALRAGPAEPAAQH